jgi:acetate kinase
MSTVLVFNCGSSSVKYELIDPSQGERVATGSVQRIGEERGSLEHTHGDRSHERELPVPTHQDALGAVLQAFTDWGPALADAAVAAVGHRVVMGGEDFDRATLVDDDVVATIERWAPLAPLHNPPNLVGIAVARALFPELPHVAVFDTAFFHGLPPAASTYAIDRDVAARHSVRRFGFHGTSHQYVAGEVAELLGPSEGVLRQVVLHLGNGASASAVVGGRPVDTSMGLTPLEGLVMGTRPGDLDPGVVLHLARNAGLGVDDIDDLLNRRSGLKGLTGHNDLRDVHRLADAGDPGAGLALDVYVHRLRKYVGAYAAVMGGIDALTFTAGVGENDAVIRARTTQGLAFLGVEVDAERNEARSTAARLISPDGAPVAVLVVPTDEELAIATQTMALVDGPAGPGAMR